MKEQTRAQRTAFGHLLEYQHGWEYRVTHVQERDHPDGWDHMSTQPEGWTLNTDRVLNYDDQNIHHNELLTPGVIRVVNAASGPMLVAHWRRRRKGTRL